MTPEERIAWSIENAAAMMKVSNEEAARRLDALHGPKWRERLMLPVPDAQSNNVPEVKASSTEAK